MDFKTYRVVFWIVFLAFVGGVLAIPVHLAVAQEEGAVELIAADEDAPESEVFPDTDDMDAEKLEGDIMIAFGTLTAVAKGKLTVSEYDFDTDRDVEIIYMVDEDTEYENVADASKLSAEDPVEIIYLEMDGKRFALVVTKEQLDLDDALLAGDDELDMEALGTEGELMPEDLPLPVDLP